MIYETMILTFAFLTSFILSPSSILSPSNSQEQYVSSTTAQPGLGKNFLQDDEEEEEKRPRERPNYQSIAQELYLLRGNQRVAAELQLVDSQYKQLLELTTKMRTGLRDLAKEISSLDSKQRQDAITDYYQEIRDKADQILLPHQSRRLAQLAIQSALSKRGISPEIEVLNHQKVIAELGLSDKEIAAIKAQVEKENERIAEELKKMRQKAKENILSKLTRRQREKLKEMIGEEFNFKSFEQSRDFADDDDD